uniref:Secreted peptide n=1 Tax=Anopheles braziliensis TaxID=58242 RepID=A0A2M3ZLR4_9DIPT
MGLARILLSLLVAWSTIHANSKLNDATLELVVLKRMVRMSGSTRDRHQSAVTVERIDLSHIILAQLEIEHIKVGGNA